MLRSALAIACVCIATAVALRLGIGSAAAESAKPSEQDVAKAWAQLKAAHPALITDERKNGVSQSPCANSITRLIVYGLSDPDVHQTLEKARIGMTQPPPSAAPQKNIWYGATSVEDLLARMVDQAVVWCTALPTIVGNDDDGLKYIGAMYWFFYKNEAGMHFAHGESALPPHKPFANGFNYCKEFSIETGRFMDTPASAANVKQWVDDPRVEIEDYQKTRAEDYKSWNDFFTRKLKVEIDHGKETIPSRPVTMPDRDYVVSAPTDCIMNPLIQGAGPSGAGAARGLAPFIDNPLQQDTVIDIKGLPLTVAQLLRGVPDHIASQFNGGTGLSCILMPNTYHHYHAPVSGKVVYAAVVDGPTFGYYDWPNLMPSSHNPAQPGTDFTQFEIYQRGVIIIAVGDLDNPIGYVASIPVGLDTIGSVVLNNDIIPSAGHAPEVTRGVTELGYFQYEGPGHRLDPDPDGQSDRHHQFAKSGPRPDVRAVRRRRQAQRGPSHLATLRLHAPCLPPLTSRRNPRISGSRRSRPRA